MSMAVMLAHCASFWLVFNLPIDTMFKVSAELGRGSRSGGSGSKGWREVGGLLVLKLWVRC